MVSIWIGFFTLLVTGLYRGRLLASLMIIKAEQPIQSFSEIAEEVDAGRLKFILLSPEALPLEMLSTAENEEFRSARSVGLVC